MADPVVKVLEPPEDIALISLADLKTLLVLSPTDTSHDAQLEMLIDQNSAAIASECNRVLAREKVRETWRCVAPVCCPDGMCRIWLTRFPVLEADIESVETPAGSIIDPSGYELEEDTGKLTLLNGCSSDVVITYTGGYDLPGEAPPDLQQLTAMLVREMRNSIARDSTVGSGVRMLGHKESRVIYFAPKDLVPGGSSSGATSPLQSATKSILSKYTRYSI